MTPQRPAPPSSLSSAPTAGPRAQPWKRWLFDDGPALLLMVGIFVASTDVGSSAHSGQILRHLLSWLGLARHLTPGQFEAVNHYVRKAGHLGEYALLGGLLHRAASSHWVEGGWGKRWVPRRVLGVLALVALYAASDELHQRFVASRTSSVWDVMLDIVGGALGLGIKGWWERWRRRSSG
jgi:VanZ family protein